jgi:hypothetical protein
MERSNILDAVNLPPSGWHVSQGSRSLRTDPTPEDEIPQPHRPPIRACIMTSVPPGYYYNDIPFNYTLLTHTSSTVSRNCAVNRAYSGLFRSTSQDRRGNHVLGSEVTVSNPPGHKTQHLLAKRAWYQGQPERRSLGRDPRNRINTLIFTHSLHRFRSLRQPCL